MSRAENFSREPLTLENQCRITVRRNTFTNLIIWGPYFYQQDVGSRWPLAATLSLGVDSYSDFLRELSEYVGVRLPYNVACDLEARFLDQLAPSKR